MSKQKRHEMIFDGTLPSGDEEWSCPVCGRRTLITWEPDFKRTILEAGDNYAIHSANKGGLRIGSLEVNAADIPAPQEDPQTSDEDKWLSPWFTWLQKVDFENLWNDEAQ